MVLVGFQRGIGHEQGKQAGGTRRRPPPSLLIDPAPRHTTVSRGASQAAVVTSPCLAVAYKTCRRPPLSSFPPPFSHRVVGEIRASRSTVASHLSQPSLPLPHKPTEPPLASYHHRNRLSDIIFLASIHSRRCEFLRVVRAPQHVTS